LRQNREAADDLPDGERRMNFEPACCDRHRRGFLACSAAASLVAVGAAGAPSQTRAASLSESKRNAMSPDQVVQALLDGNSRFLSGVHKTRNFLAEMRSSASGQFPATVVLSCIDSRAPVEVICDLGIGDIFNARVAGNAVNDDILGSLEFACAAAGAKAVVVMGHTSCGAIKGAIDNVVLGNLTLLLARFKSAIDATVYDGARTSKNAAFVDAVARTHVLRSMALIRERSPVLADLEGKGAIKIVGSMYDIASGKVTML
jgi:carbonic anhydrase